MNESGHPRVGTDVYMAPTSYVGGDVVLGDQVTIMHHVVIRGDIGPIRIGNRVNVQDGSILHTPHGVPLDIDGDVGIGHRAIVHCRRIGRRSLIGMGSVLLDDCIIGSRRIIAAGTVLAPGTIVADGTVMMGIPGKVVREVEDRDLAAIDHVVDSYLQLGRQHAAGRFTNIAAS